jgi:hypothetical protein
MPRLQKLYTLKKLVETAHNFALAELNEYALQMDKLIISIDDDIHKESLS